MQHARCLLILMCCVSAVSCTKDDGALQSAHKETSESPFELQASIQELMQAMVDPAADSVWEVSGATVTSKGVEEHQPRTEEEWQQARNGMITLIESTNLLAMKGRRLVPVGGKVLDEGSEGVLTAEEGQKRLDSQHAMFAQFAAALRESAKKMLKAVDAKNPKAMMDIGSEMDAICENCHMTFWYPDQMTFSVQTNAAQSAK
jgi:hypothetical protein